MYRPMVEGVPPESLGAHRRVRSVQDAQEKAGIQAAGAA